MATPSKGIGEATVGAVATTTVATAADVDPFSALLQGIAENHHDPNPTYRDEMSPAGLAFSADIVAALIREYKLPINTLFATNVPGRIGFRPTSPANDREFVEQLEGDVDGFKKCEEILLGEEGEKKCEWLKEAAKQHAETTAWDVIKEYAGYAVMTVTGGTVAGFTFHAGGQLFHKLVSSTPHMIIMSIGASLLSAQQAHDERLLREGA